MWETARTRVQASDGARDCCLAYLDPARSSGTLSTPVGSQSCRGAATAYYLPALALCVRIKPEGFLSGARRVLVFVCPRERSSS